MAVAVQWRVLDLGRLNKCLQRFFLWSTNRSKPYASAPGMGHWFPPTFKQRSHLESTGPYPSPYILVEKGLIPLTLVPGILVVADSLCSSKRIIVALRPNVLCIGLDIPCSAKSESSEFWRCETRCSSHAPGLSVLKAITTYPLLSIRATSRLGGLSFSKARSVRWNFLL